ncbi:M23 family metallopeptidase [uncultured Draconibacterium sp.]|uniref:M23 family metallopeptidase n=1 Tax=uncultured Draconibacterium sp. TaxID=1573823 RepID=UPI0029C63DC4|nr:M23 family metallopeptidase [uncultured Draconibacterium sp.]
MKLLLFLSFSLCFPFIAKPQNFNSVSKEKQFKTIQLVDSKTEIIKAGADTHSVPLLHPNPDTLRVHAGTDNAPGSVLFSPPLRHLAVTSGFGYRFHPILKSQMFHSGIDFQACNDTVFAILAGIISNQTESPGYGKRISIFLGKQYECLYAHLSQTLVSTGEWVEPGQAIGITGNTGLSTGEHLHFEITNAGKPVNPLPFLATLTKYYNQFEYAGKEKLSFIYDE